METAAGRVASVDRQVTINGAPPRPGFAELEALLAAPVPDGDYWYDPMCGAYGMLGGQALGFLPAGLDIAESLPADASGGGTGVVINGRELHPLDVAALNQILMRAGAQCLPGRWWLDAAGNLGAEGGPPLTNLGRLLQVGGGGGSSWSTWYGSGGDSGGAGYVMTPSGTATYGM